MNFLYPAFLIGSVLAAIPIVLHLLRRDVAPDVPFTAVRLLRKAPVERTNRRRLRDLLLLAARVAALLLLAGGFARPYLVDGGAAPLRVVAIDRSYSMGAPGQFERALARARSAIAAAGPQRVAVVAFDDRAQVVAEPGGEEEATAALADLRVGFGGTRFGPVFAKARDLAEGAPGTLVIVSDLQRAGWEEQGRALLPPGFELVIEDVGAPEANLAVTAARLEAGRLVASIRNAGTRDRQGDVRALLDGRVVASQRFAAAADAIVDVPIAYRPPAAGVLTVAVDDEEGFAADNARFVLLDPLARPAALIVTSAGDARSGFYLQRAIEAASAGDSGFDARLASGGELASMTPDGLARYRAIVLLSTRGIDRRARGPVGAFVRSGGGLFVTASPDVEASVLSMLLDWQPALAATQQGLTAASFSATDVRHPIFRPFGPLTANLGHVRFDRSWRVRGEGWTVLARFSDGAPALLERDEGTGRVILFASDFDRRWNDFPLHASFVPFAFETLRHVAGGDGESREYVVARAPAGVPAEPGVHQLRGRSIAVNVDPAESSLARLTGGEIRAAVDRVDAAASGAADRRAQLSEARQSYWRYALLLMLGVLVVESFIGKA